MDETEDKGDWPTTQQQSDIEEGLPLWMVPVRRSDDVGLLAWRLTGPKPDVTVVPALIDALQESGDTEQASKIKQWVGEAVNQLHRERLDGYLLNELSWHLWLDRRDETYHLLYDLNSMVSVLAQATSKDNKVEYTLAYHLPNNEGSVYNLKTLRPVRKGRSVEFDGKTGLVLDEVTTNGWVKVLVTNDNPSVEGT